MIFQVLLPNFGIDLLPDTNPISIPPYQMALVKSNDLKAQLNG